jgi:hypothetical protein
LKESFTKNIMKGNILAAPTWPKKGDMEGWGKILER